MSCNTSAKIRSCPRMPDLIHGIRFDRLTSAASRRPTPTVWPSMSAVRVAALILAGVCCAILSAPVNAGFVASNGLNPDQNTASPLDVLPALGYAGLQYGDYDLERLSNESTKCETQNVTEKPAELSALPLERPVPFQTPMSNGWDFASSGPGFTGSKTSRTSSGGGSAGLLNENGRLPEPLQSTRRHRQEFPFIPAAPVFELLHPS